MFWIIKGGTYFFMRRLYVYFTSHYPPDIRPLFDYFALLPCALVGAAPYWHSLNVGGGWVGRKFDVRSIN